VAIVALVASGYMDHDQQELQPVVGKQQQQLGNRNTA